MLGDGDFSFSKALLLGLSSFPDYSACLFVLTSFDSEAELVEKYPETRGFLKSFSKQSNVIVRHGIDATKSLDHLLQDVTVEFFTDIIFNFPHLAVENAKLHSCLLGHVVYRSKQVLHSDGTLYISLAEAQAERWRLHDMVELNSCRIHEQLKFDVYHDWGGLYNIKRHHNAQSFVKRVGACACYCIKR